MNIIADEAKLQNDPIANLAVETLKSEFTSDLVNLYYQYPIYRGDLPEDLVQAQLLLTSPDFGVVYIKCHDGDSFLNDAEIKYIEELDSNIFKRFISHQELRISKRELKFSITGIVLGQVTETKDDLRYCNIKNLCQTINSLAKDKALSSDEYNLLVSCIDNTTKLSLKKARKVEENVGDHPTKGQILNLIQNREACFDQEQRRVAMSCIDSPQRIRGLAGSGKTILLTMKAALYHLANPNAEILYTYYTKDLHEQIRRLIERFYREASDNHEPDWKKIHILHAWGGMELPGVYSETCSRLHIHPINYQIARARNANAPFDYVCEELLKEAIEPYYDLTLIDEGQDFHCEFYRLCYKLTKNRRIVWAYDEFQNIFETDLQDEKQTFGKDDNGEYCVDFGRHENPNQDIVLHCCYRTPRKVLIGAFSLGLGIYNEKVLQRLPSNMRWTSLGFDVERGNCADGDQMVISRPIKNTPSVLNEQFGTYIMSWKSFDYSNDECKYVAEQIIKNIEQEGLLPDDICVICLDQRNIATYYSYLCFYLNQKGIRSFNMLNAPNTNTKFTHDSHVTLATLNKAKGNEAGMVYIMGADVIFKVNNNVKERNRLFTAITRAKGWVMITGTGKEYMNKLSQELNMLINNDMRLVFTQPTDNQTRTVMAGSERQDNEVEALLKTVNNLKKNRSKH